MSLRRALAAALLVPLALLGACTEDEPVPQMPDPTTSSPSPTESTSTAAPETPEEFIRRFMAEEVAMQNSGETDDYLAMTSGCDSCEDFARLVEKYYGAGGYVRLKPWRVIAVKAYPDHGPHAYAATIEAPITRYKKSSSGKELTFPGGRSKYVYEITSDSADRRVSYYAKLAS